MVELTMDYGRYNGTGFMGESKPTYNWGVIIL